MRPSRLVLFIILVTLGPCRGSSAQVRTSVAAAPTFYIGADAEFRSSEEIYLRGATNLPSGAVLIVNIYDFAGTGSSVLNQDTRIAVAKNGFFEVAIRPKPGAKFRHNIVCDVVFTPSFPTQPSSVLQVTGKSGEKMALNGKNPQAHTVSGGYYLSTMLHVP